MCPLVSVCVPNLNYCRFLDERIKSILNQTYDNLEILILDCQSSDGSWDLIQRYAASDARIVAWQTTPKGIYPTWNELIGRAKGKYITIATSDDSMMPNFVQRLVAALESYSKPAIAQCGLLMTDEQSNPLPDSEQWSSYLPSKHLGKWQNKAHVRKAPHDGVLHSAIGTVFTSHTQIVVHRDIYNRVGLYATCWGSTADIEWGMRASLLFDTVFIPQVMATWRIHGEQASASGELATKGRYLVEMVSHAIDTAFKIDPVLVSRLNRDQLLKTSHLLELACSIQGGCGWVESLKQVSTAFVSQPDLLAGLMQSIVRYGPLRNYRLAMARHLLGAYGLKPEPCPIIE